MEIYNLQLVTEQFISNIIHLQIIMQKGASGIKKKKNLNCDNIHRDNDLQ